MEETKVKQLHTDVNTMDRENSVLSELVEREQIENSPFEVITIDGYSFGTMGDYRLTEKRNSKKKVKEELKAITWNRIIQVIMILDEVKTKIKPNKKSKK